MISTRLARLNFPCERFTGANFTDYEQLPGQIGGAHGKAIAHRARERRVVAIRGHRLGEHPAGRFREANRPQLSVGPGPRTSFPRTHWRACSKVSVATTAIVPLDVCDSGPESRPRGAFAGSCGWKRRKTISRDRVPG